MRCQDAGLSQKAARRSAARAPCREGSARARRSLDTKRNHEDFQSAAWPRQQGFTLLELLVVLLIIALLAGYVGPKLFSQVDAPRCAPPRRR